MTKPNKSVKLPELTSEDMPAGVAEAEIENASAMAEGAPGAVTEANEMLNLDAVMRIPVNIQVVLGSATMQVANLMKLRRGAVVQLDHRVGEPVDVVVNGRIIARGEVVIVEDDNSRFGVSLTEIVGVQAKFEA
jgi:flagellar motor switch protein FliN/FliY